jgi:hypothetical protein
LPFLGGHGSLSNVRLRTSAIYLVEDALDWGSVEAHRLDHLQAGGDITLIKHLYLGSRLGKAFAKGPEACDGMLLQRR